MKNLSRQAKRRLFDFSDSAPHGINPLQALLFLSVVLPFARAQSGTDSPPDYSYQFNTSINPSMAIIIAILVCAFFFVGFFAVYLRHCMDSSSGSGADGLLLGGGGRRPQRVSAIGLDPEVIESFPIVIYSAVKDLKIGKAALECAVCLNELEDDDSLRLLPKCDHVFHPECIDAWLASHTTCPVCRTNLIPDPNEIPKNSEQTHNSNESSGLGEVQNQVSIDIRQDQAESDSQTVEISSTTSQILKQNRPPRSRSTTIGRIYGKFPRSHSTGHSLIQPGGEGFERYTLRLPEEIRKQIVMNSKLKRTKSYGVVLPREGSSRRGYRSGGEGSSKGRSYLDRGFGRFDRRSKSDRWVFTMAPPFLSRLGSIKSTKLGGSGEATAQDANSKTSVALVPKPSDSLAVEVDGAGQSSARP